MPHIEAHGFLFETFRELEEFKDFIKAIFSDWSCADTLTIEMFVSRIETRKGEQRIYLRVLDTDADQGKKIARRLRLEEFDVQFVCLDGFFSQPLYSLQEIRKELSWLIERIDWTKAMCEIYSGNPALAISAFGRSIGQMKALHPDFQFPSPAEMSAKWEMPPEEARGTEEGVKASWIRWHQMLKILEG